MISAKIDRHELESWAIGPFTRPVEQPIVKPTADLVFDCPMKKEPVRWAENHTFNPAAIVHENRIHVLFRAEDGLGDRIGSYTSRIGDAVSDDGVSFDLQPEPLIYPAEDDLIGHEWPGGCEDARIVVNEEGLYAVYYTMYNRLNPKNYPVLATLGVATSPDLKNWTKHGLIFAEAGGIAAWHKAAGVVQKIEDGRLVAARIEGKYWMYWGEEAVCLATSTDLVNWTPVRDDKGDPLIILAPRKGYFDSSLTEIGPPPVLTDDGIVLIYNGKNDDTEGDPGFGPGAYCGGQVLLDKQDPSQVLDRLDKPFIEPELPFEKTGQYRHGTVFTEGLVLFKNQWFLYYGMSDKYVGVAKAQYQ